MSSNKDNDKYVTYKQVIITSIALIGVLSSIMFFVVSSHASRPHEGSMTKQLFYKLMTIRDSQLSRIEKKIDMLDIKINKIDNYLNKLSGKFNTPYSE